MARNIDDEATGRVHIAKRAYFRMVKKLNLDSPELEAFEKEREFKRKRANLKETAARQAAEIQMKARKYTDHILEKMIEIATSEDATVTDSARIQAAHFVYDRAYGKAAQTNINANMNTDGKPSEITGSALNKRIEALAKRVEELIGGGSTPPASEERPADVHLGNRDPNGGTRH